MTQRVIIEPHADDAFLSLGGHLDLWSKQNDCLLIVTVYSGTRKRARDAEAYASAINAGWCGLGVVEAGSTEACATVPTAAVDELQEIIDQAAPDVVYVPLGVRHVEHVYVQRLVRESIMAHTLHAYLDQPYAAAQSNGDEVSSLLSGRRIVSYLRPHAKKYRHIPLFKDQAKFFYYNPAEKMAGNIELIVE